MLTNTLRASFLLGSLLSLLLTGCQSESEPESTASAPAAATSVETTDQSAATAAKANDECKLVMGWDPWEPYHYEGVNGEVQGLDIELVSAMAEGAGCELEFERGEWSQLLQFLQDGRIDLLAGATMVEERESYARFSNPYRTETFTLHVGADAVLQGNDLNALLDNGFRLGLTEGYIYGPQITVLQDNPLMATRIIYAPIAEYHFNNLKDGRIDGFLEDPYVAEATARRHGWTNLTRELPLRFGGEEVRLMFSRETVDEAVVERMNRALAEMRSDGSHTEILQQYQHQGP